MDKQQAGTELAQLQDAYRRLRRAETELHEAYMNSLVNEGLHPYNQDFLSLANGTSALMRAMMERMTALDEVLHCTPQKEQQEQVTDE